MARPTHPVQVMSPTTHARVTVLRDSTERVVQHSAVVMHEPSGRLTAAPDTEQVLAPSLIRTRTILS
jgi:hypothetical protein